MYSTCGIHYKGDGFKIEEVPTRKRTFQFFPGAHEDCIKCEERGDARCISQRNLLQKFSPYYGIVVVASSYPEDYDFTLANDGKPIKELNLLDDDHLTTRNHWLDRAGLVTSELELDNRTKRVKKEVEVEVVEAARSIFVEKQATLTEIVQFFKAMGFEKLLILDPTCRYFDIPDFQSFSQDPTQLTYSEDRASEFVPAYDDSVKHGNNQSLGDFVSDNLRHWPEYKKYKQELKSKDQDIDFKTFLETSKTWSYFLEGWRGYAASFAGILRKPHTGRGGKTRRKI
jgi:hypothetical protein